MTTLQIDFETRSVVDLRKCGVYVYAEDPSTEILCMAYAFDDEEPRLLKHLEFDAPGSNKENGRIYRHIEAGGEIRAWNAQFERTIWAEQMAHLGWPEPKLEQWHCTAAEAAAMSLPRALEMAAKVLGLKVQKDEEGRKLMLKMSKPRKPTKKDPSIWHDSPEMRQRLGEYCLQDVRTERAVAACVRRLGKMERAVYLLDQKINDRGVMVDLPLVHAAQEIVDEGTRRANAEMEEITGGEVSGVTKVQDIRFWMGAAGVETANLKKDTVRDLLAGEGGELPEDVRRVIELRSEAAKTSTSKLAAMVRASCRDGRARGCLLYHGAGTGRWAGKLLQPQNFTRPVVKKVERYIPYVLENQFDLIESEHPAIAVVSSMLRSMLIAGPGCHFLSGDYAQIEARIVAWLASQDDLVELFANKGKIYETMAAYIFKKTVAEIGKESFERQVGKNTVLGCGFGMGWKTFQRQAKVQAGLDLTDAISQAGVNGYRELYPRVPLLWQTVNSAAIKAVRKPGIITACGRNNCIRFTARGQFLWCILPSGRTLAYAKPRIEDRLTPWGEMRSCVTFAAQNGLTRKWERFAGYGGLWVENIVQAVARDLMAMAMLRVERAGYPVVLSVHDELLAEVPDDFGSLEEYHTLMRRAPQWADGLPVAVEGWSGQRYKK